VFTAHADASGSDPKVSASRSRNSSGRRTNILKETNDRFLGTVNAGIVQCRTKFVRRASRYDRSYWIAEIRSSTRSLNR